MSAVPDRASAMDIAFLAGHPSPKSRTENLRYSAQHPRNAQVLQFHPEFSVVSKLLRLSGLCKELLNAVGGQRVRTMLFCWDDDDWCLRDAGAQLEHESPQAICCQAEMS